MRLQPTATRPGDVGSFGKIRENVYGLSDRLSGSPRDRGQRARRISGMRGAIEGSREFMETKPGFIQLISAVIGLSLGVSVMTATVLLGVAALFQ